MLEDPEVYKYDIELKVSCFLLEKIMEEKPVSSDKVEKECFCSNQILSSRFSERMDV